MCSPFPRLLTGLAMSVFLAGSVIAQDNVVIAGKVLLDGKPFPGASVSAKGATVLSGADGAFRLEGIPALRDIAFRSYSRAKDNVIEYMDLAASVPFIVVAAYGETEEGGVLGIGKRKVGRGVVRIVPSGDARVPLTLELQAVEDWDGYCRKCHPASPELEGRPILRPAPKDAPRPIVDQGLFTRHRYRDSHPSGFDYRKAALGKSPRKPFSEKVEGLPLRDGKIVDCRTCHTFHVAGPVPSFTREEFRDRNTLCMTCHR